MYPDGAVRLAGYSFGACVAIEMALQMQQQDSSGSVQSLMLLDGSHSFVAAYTDRTRQRVALSGDTASIESGVICTFVSQFAFRLARSEEVCSVYFFHSQIYSHGLGCSTAGRIDENLVFTARPHCLQCRAM